jgi:geranylgeranyl pyrophosphate synthase
VEDNSPVRRGHPSVHIVFGISQTINSATYQYVNALRFVTALKKETIGCFIRKWGSFHIYTLK